MCLRQKLNNIFESHLTAVDDIFVLVIAVHHSLNRYFVKINV